MNKKHKPRHKKYYQIINPIHHLEKTVIKLDKDNDRLQSRVILLSLVSVLLALLSVLLALLNVFN